MLGPCETIDINTVFRNKKEQSQIVLDQLRLRFGPNRRGQRADLDSIRLYRRNFPCLNLGET